MMPVRDHETLLRAVQDERTVTELSRRFDVTGVHMFCLGEEAVYCSNFAPLYDLSLIHILHQDLRSLTERHGKAGHRG